MPKATTSKKPQRFELKSCPGGFVDLRRMTHGERLHRQDIAMDISMQSDQRNKTAEMSITPTQTLVVQFEFASCIVGHNLELDDEGTLINFKAPEQFAELDGRIGEEISAHIETLHDWESNLPNSDGKSTISSTVVVDHSQIQNSTPLTTE
jgi:hypothetical protein